MAVANPSVVDANVVVRFLVRDDEALFERALQFWTAVTEGRAKAFLSGMVIAESVYVLERVYKVPRQEISDSLAMLLLHDGVAAEDKTATLNALRSFAGHPSLSFVDAYRLELAAGRGWKVMTFDRKLFKRAQRRAVS